MQIALHSIPIRALVNGYQNSRDTGIIGYGGLLNIRPPYQREFRYDTQQKQAVIHTISGVYSSEFTDKTELDRAREMADEFEELTGRRPRIFVAKMGQDGHDRGQKVIASSFADMGWDVDVGPLFQTPAETAQDAVDNDVHMVGFSSLAAGHNTLLPQLVDELKKLGRDDIMVCIGGVIPVQDYDNLYEHGAVAIFAPGTNIPEAGIKLLTLLIERAKEEAAG